VSISENHQQMLNRYFDGLLNGEELAKLESLLVADANLRSQFWQEVNFSILLEEAAQFGAGATDKAEPFAEPPATSSEVLVAPRNWREAAYAFIANYAALSMLVSGVFIASMLLVLWIVPERKPASPGNSPSTQFVARISHVSQASFDKTSDGNLIKRALLADDKIAVNAGLVVIEYDSGARVVLEGPATYHLQGDNGGVLRVGKLLAQVPPAAHGFTVNSPSGKVVDLGTEFGMIVSDDGARTELQVYEGAVEMSTSSGNTRRYPPRRLKAGQALAIERTTRGNADGSPAYVHHEQPVDRSGFLSLATALAASRTPPADGASISVTSVATTDSDYDLTNVYGIGDWAYWELGDLSGAPLNEKSGANLIGPMSPIGDGNLLGSSSTARPRHDLRFVGDGTEPNTGDIRNPIGLRNAQLDKLGVGVQVSVASPTADPFKIYVWATAYRANATFTASVGSASGSDRSLSSPMTARPGRLYTVTVDPSDVGQWVTLRLTLNGDYGENANVSLAAVAVDTPARTSQSPNAIVEP
jgi:hypothetical protein